MTIGVKLSTPDFYDTLFTSTLLLVHQTETFDTVLDITTWRRISEYVFDWQCSTEHHSRSKLGN